MKNLGYFASDTELSKDMCTCGSRRVANQRHSYHVSLLTGWNWPTYSIYCFM